MGPASVNLQNLKNCACPESEALRARGNVGPDFVTGTAKTVDVSREISHDGEWSIGRCKDIRVLIMPRTV